MVRLDPEQIIGGAQGTAPQQATARVPVLKVGYSGGGGWLVCHEVGMPDEDARLSRIFNEAAQFIAEDVAGAEMLPARVALLPHGRQLLEGEGQLCTTRGELYSALSARLPKVVRSRRLEVHDRDGNFHTVVEAEMTVEECERLPEWQGW